MAKIKQLRVPAQKAYSHLSTFPGSSCPAKKKPYSFFFGLIEGSEKGDSQGKHGLWNEVMFEKEEKKLL